MGFQRGKLLRVCKGHAKCVPAVVALLDNKMALSGSWDKTLKLWDIRSGECIKTFEEHNESVHSVVASKDGRYAISGDFDGIIKVWDIETGEVIRTLKGHTDIVKSVKFKPYGNYAVSGSNDQTVKLWDLEAGVCKGTFEGHQKDVPSIDISPDGSLIASTGFTDWTIRLWDLKTGACLQVITIEGFPTSVAFSQVGSRLVVGTYEGPLYVYKVTTLRTALALEASSRYTNAKVVLLGESGVGKSGLAHRIIEDKFINTSSTHGMQVWRADLPVTRKKSWEREALLWDLAGQDDYRLIHQLFLEETTVALMLFNPQEDDPFAKVGDWLKALQTATGKKDVIKLLIAARCDRGMVKISQKKIDRFLKEYKFAGYLFTSAKTGINCSDRKNNNSASPLKRLIAKHIPWDKLPWTTTPELIKELKNAVLDMTEDEGAVLMRFPELVQRLEQKLLDKSFEIKDAETAVTLLGNHGLVKPLPFGDLVLLRPEELNNYASAVINAARSHTDEIGAVIEDDVFNGNIEFSDMERLPRADEKLLLRAMVQMFLEHSLCIVEEIDSKRHLIFPSQYRRERDYPELPEIFVSYSFTGELATIYTTLVVRLWYSREFKNKELWRNAAEFIISGKKKAGFIMERTGEGEGTISVFFDAGAPDDFKVIFIKFVHEHLHRYGQEVCRDRRYVCKCKKPVKDLAAVRYRMANGRDFIVCIYCDEKVPLIDDIERRLATDKVAKKVIEMDAYAGIELNNQAKEQILIGHIMTICGDANQVFRPVTMFDFGIDGEIEFKGNDGKPSGKKVYLQLKSGDSFLRLRKSDKNLIFDVDKKRHLKYWAEQVCDVYLVIRKSDGEIEWMNVTEYLKNRKDKRSMQIVFTGGKLDTFSLLKLRDRYIKFGH